MWVRERYKGNWGRGGGRKIVGGEGGRGGEEREKRGGEGGRI